MDKHAPYWITLWIVLALCSMAIIGIAIENYYDVQIAAIEAGYEQVTDKGYSSYLWQKTSK